MKPIKYYAIITLLCFPAFAGFSQMHYGINHSNKSSGTSSDHFKVHFYRCDWTVDPAVRYIQGFVQPHFTILQSTQNIQFDLSSQLIVDSVVYQNQKIAFHQNTADIINIHFSNTLYNNDTASVTIFYKGVPAVSGFGSFINEKHNNTPVMWTLSEPFGAKDWWPCKNDIVNKADSIEITLHYPKQYVASSNGVLINESVQNNLKTSVFKHRYPIASYLVAFAITNYMVQHNKLFVGNDSLDYYSYYYPENANNWQTAAQTIQNIFNRFYEWMGTYPFIKEKYAQTQFSWGGGMEHQTNSFVVNTDYYLMAHELAHQWFGNKLTPYSWKDLWLSEGLATFFGTLALQSNTAASYQLMVQQQHDYVTSLPDGSIYTEDTTDINRLFNNRLTYDKACYFFRMLHLKLGDDFFKMIKNYLNDSSNAYQSVTVENLKYHAERIYKSSLDRFFHQWINGEGYPGFKVKWYVNNNGYAKLMIEQTTSHPSVTSYEMDLPLLFTSGSNKTEKIIKTSGRYDTMWVYVGFNAQQLIIDEGLMTLSKNNVSLKVQPPEKMVNIKAYPNPFQNNLMVDLINVPPQTVSIYVTNSLGQIVSSTHAILEGYDKTIPISYQNLIPGWYHIMVKGSKGIFHQQKIIHLKN